MISWRPARRRQGGTAEAPPAAEPAVLGDPDAAATPAGPATTEAGPPGARSECPGPDLPAPECPPPEAGENLSSTEGPPALPTTEGGDAAGLPTAPVTDQDPPTAPAGPGTPMGIGERGSEGGPHPEPGTGPPLPPPTVWAAAAGEGDVHSELVLEPADRVHWAVAAAVVLVTGAAVAALLLLAGHVL